MTAKIQQSSEDQAAIGRGTDEIRSGKFKTAEDLRAFLRRR